MTQIPEMIALLHGCGALGFASLSIDSLPCARAPDLTNAIALYLSIMIGGFNIHRFCHRLGKLSEKNRKPIFFPPTLCQYWFNSLRFLF